MQLDLLFWSNACRLLSIPKMMLKLESALPRGSQDEDADEY